MAPSNLNQVFVINNPDLFSTTTFSNTAATTNATRLGVWDVYGSTPSNVVTALFTSGVPNFKSVQFTQTMLSGNCIATPIIDLKDIVRINYREYTSAVPNVQKAVIDAGASAAAATSGSDPIMMRIAIRTAPTNYEYFANPASSYGDLSGGGYTFPLIGNFSAGRMIFNIEIPETVHSPGGTYSETALITALFNNFSGSTANETLKAIFAATDSGASGLELVARHYGVTFDVTLSQNNVTQGTVTMSMVAPTAASNYILAVADEKKQRARYGNFNRMYFPTEFPTFAQPTYKYDIIEIAYKHAHPASTGIARAAELNTLRIYAGASSTALTYAGASTGTELATVFGYSGGADSEQLF